VEAAERRVLQAATVIKWREMQDVAKKSALSEVVTTPSLAAVPTERPPHLVLTTWDALVRASARPWALTVIPATPRLDSVPANLGSEVRDAIVVNPDSGDSRDWLMADPAAHRVSVTFLALCVTTVSR